MVAWKADSDFTIAELLEWLKKRNDGPERRKCCRGGAGLPAAPSG